jgi:hypothetical protein
MSRPLDDVLAQYGLNNGAPAGAATALALNPTTAPAPGVEVDPAIGASPVDNVQQALQYARQLEAQAKPALHAAAQAASRAPGIVGAAATGIAQATQPDQPIVSVPAADVVALIRQHESGNDYSALNKEGSSASGAYQYTNGTWGNYGGYSRAALAPRKVQDARALQDVTANLQKYGGDPFKAIAAHYLPAAAKNPALWDKPYPVTVHGKTIMVSPVADYIRSTVANTPLEGQFDAYLQHYSS